jgi:hypothetical protein
MVRLGGGNARRGETRARERGTRTAESWPEEDGSRIHGAVGTVYLVGSWLPKVAGDDKKDRWIW